jgi:CRISPR-associated exonuclease Cas4
MMPDDDLIALSALQHFLFCPRQCALIHVEQAWAENAATAEGRVGHERVHAEVSEVRRGIRTVTGMPLRSDRLGVTGIADVVELRRGAEGGWRPYPVEHKRGRPKAHRADEVQLCAQAFALEEMFAVTLPEGALFYGLPRRRSVVAFDRKRCDACSLIEICHPLVTGNARSAAAWLADQVE